MAAETKEEHEQLRLAVERWLLDRPTWEAEFDARRRRVAEAKRRLAEFDWNDRRHDREQDRWTTPIGSLGTSGKPSRTSGA